MLRISVPPFLARAASRTGKPWQRGEGSPDVLPVLRHGSAGGGLVCRKRARHRLELFGRGLGRTRPMAERDVGALPFQFAEALVVVVVRASRLVMHDLVTAREGKRPAWPRVRVPSYHAPPSAPTASTAPWVIAAGFPADLDQRGSTRLLVNGVHRAIAAHGRAEQPAGSGTGLRASFSSGLARDPRPGSGAMRHKEVSDRCHYEIGAAGMEVLLDTEIYLCTDSRR